MSLPFDTDSPHGARLRSLVSRLRDLETQKRAIEADQRRVLGELSRLSLEEAARYPQDTQAAGVVYQQVGHEAGLVLGLSDRSGERLMWEGDRLQRQYPAVLSELEQGKINAAQAEAITWAGLIIDDDSARPAYEAAALGAAAAKTAAQTRRLAKSLAETHAHRGFDERHRRAKSERRVWVDELEDGMSRLSAVMETPLAVGAFNRLTEQARSVRRRERRLKTLAIEEQRRLDTARRKTQVSREAAQHAREAAWKRSLSVDDVTQLHRAEEVWEDEGGPARPDPAESVPRVVVDIPVVRTLDQARADIAADTLLHGEPSNECGEVSLAGIQAKVQVTVPVLSLLPEGSQLAQTISSVFGVERGYLGVAGLQGAAVLAGYGPISSEAVRLLAGLQTGWDAVQLHPKHGAVLSTGRYTPTEAIKRFVLARDLRCRWPGCSVAAVHADLDHTVPYLSGGRTTTANLSALCERHHVMKHRSGVTVRQRSGGELVWTTPGGQTVVDLPESSIIHRPAPPRISQSGSKSVPAPAGPPPAARLVRAGRLVVEDRSASPCGSKPSHSSPLPRRVPLAISPHNAPPRSNPASQVRFRRAPDAGDRGEPDGSGTNGHPF